MPRKLWALLAIMAALVLCGCVEQGMEARMYQSRRQKHLRCGLQRSPHQRNRCPKILVLHSRFPVAIGLAAAAAVNKRRYGRLQSKI